MAGPAWPARSPVAGDRPPDPAPLGIGLIGLGVIAQYYLRALQAARTGHLVGLADLDERKLRGFEAGVTATTDYTELLASEDVAAVVVTAPNDRHYQICLDALLAGKHVCCEKPLTLDPREAKELQSVAEERGRVLFTAFHRRYNQNVRILAGRRDGIKSAEIEYMERIEEHVDDDSWYLDPARCGGGCIADNGPNAFDTLDLLLGPPRVVATRVERDARGVDVRAEIHLECGESLTPARVLLDWAYPFGERKQVHVEYADGRIARAGMLDKWPAFKSSLLHEYEGVIADFVAAVARCERRGGDGAAMAQLVADSYALAEQAGPVRAPTIAAEKATVAGRFVKLLRHKRHDRGMTLMSLESRCVLRGEVHEIVTTSQTDATPGDRIDEVGFLGFAEFLDGGVIERGDAVIVAGRQTGQVIGFDECHFPNHYNVLIAVPELVTATDLSLAVGNTITFAPMAK